MELHLGGLFKYHLYVGCHFTDTVIAEELCKKFNDYGLITFPRYERCICDNVRSRINHGVFSSIRCVILLTNNYMNDEYSRYEIEEIKNASVGNKNMITVLKCLTDVPEILQEFSIHSFDDAYSILANMETNFVIVSPAIIVTPPSPPTHFIATVNVVPDDAPDIALNIAHIPHFSSLRHDGSNVRREIITNIEPETSTTTTITSPVSRLTGATLVLAPRVIMDETIMLTNEIGKLVQILLTPPITSLIQYDGSQGMGYTYAAYYFQDSLKHMLPDFNNKCIKLANEYDFMEDRIIDKLLLVIPKSCHGTPTMIQNGKIEIASDNYGRTPIFMPYFSHRSGNISKDSKFSVYKILVPGNNTVNQWYYYIGEFASPIVTMYDLCNNAPIGLNEKQMSKDRNIFYYTLCQMLESCNLMHHVKVLLWDDSREANGEYKYSLYDFLLSVVENLIQSSNAASAAAPVATPTIPISTVLQNLCPITRKFITQILVSDNPQVQPSRYYGSYEFNKYCMDTSPKGLCIIISNIDFQNTNLTRKNNLGKRDGGEKDTDKMKRLFTNLDFIVRVHKNVKLSVLKEILVTASLGDHSQYSAFVCILMSHGNLGELFMSDGNVVSIVDIFRYFYSDRCKTLSKKPKLFFIQACQKDGGEVDGILDRPGSVANTSVANTSVANATVANSPQLVVEETQPVLDQNHVCTKKYLVPECPDFIVSYSTLPGSLSFRDPDLGSLYISALYNHIGKSTEINVSLKKVTEDVEKSMQGKRLEHRRNYLYQLPFYVNTSVNKYLYLV